MVHPSRILISDIIRLILLSNINSFVAFIEQKQNTKRTAGREQNQTKQDRKQTKDKEQPKHQPQKKMPNTPETKTKNAKHQESDPRDLQERSSQLS